MCKIIKFPLDEVRNKIEMEQQIEELQDELYVAEYYLSFYRNQLAEDDIVEREEYIENIKSQIEDLKNEKVNII
jgi:cob(I)alamin adenosyltransferase